MGDELASTQADSLVPFHSHQDIELRKLLTHFGLIERFTPYVAGAGRGLLRSDEAREWLEKRRNEGVAELTLAVATIRHAGGDTWRGALLGRDPWDARREGATMTELREVELWPCAYVAKCSVPWCRQRATTILRYLDNRGLR